MNHPAELAIRAYLSKAVKGEGTISEDNLEQIASDVKSALKRQFAGPPREEFRLRMSNLGRPTCQLWYDKNMNWVSLKSQTPIGDMQYKLK